MATYIVPIDWTDQGQHPHNHSARLHRLRDEGRDQQGWLTTSTTTAKQARHTRGVSATVLA